MINNLFRILRDIVILASVLCIDFFMFLMGRYYEPHSKKSFTVRLIGKNVL